MGPEIPYPAPVDRHLRKHYLSVTTVAGGKNDNDFYFRNRHLHNLGQMDTLQTGLVGQLLLPIDWVYLPIIELYNAVVQM